MNQNEGAGRALLDGRRTLVRAPVRVIHRLSEVQPEPGARAADIRIRRTGAAARPTGGAARPTGGAASRPTGGVTRPTGATAADRATRAATRPTGGATSRPTGASAEPGAAAPHGASERQSACENQSMRACHGGGRWKCKTAASEKITRARRFVATSDRGAVLSTVETATSTSGPRGLKPEALP